MSGSCRHLLGLLGLPPILHTPLEDGHLLEAARGIFSRQLPKAEIEHASVEPWFSFSSSLIICVLSICICKPLAFESPVVTCPIGFRYIVVVIFEI